MKNNNQDPFNNKHNRVQTTASIKYNPLERLFIWLSGSDKELLKIACPKWEKIKYEAFGASVLVPVCFGMIAASYAVSTLTENWWIIIGFALVWGYIILAIDRVLLSTYRAYASTKKKLLQFVLRITVAVLMGLTISHPLTLLLFNDTVASEIEKKRGHEIAEYQHAADLEKSKIQERINLQTAEIDREQERLKDAINGEFLTPESKPVGEAVDQNPTQPEIVEESALVAIHNQIAEYKKERNFLRDDLEKWQETYDEEVRGIRSGVAGVGPNARAIEKEHLVWRKQDISKLSESIAVLEQKVTEINTQKMQQNAADAAAVAEQKRKLEVQKLETFADQQAPLIEMIKSRIEAGTKAIDSLRGEIVAITAGTNHRAQQIRTEPRDDLMSQTMALHELFTRPKDGGHFALSVYIVLAALFTLIDTIPLVVKFFAEPGPYDMLVHYRDHCLLPLGQEQNVDFLTRMKFRADMCYELTHYQPTEIALEDFVPFGLESYQAEEGSLDYQHSA